MTTAYYIVDWDQHFEVNAHGRHWTPGDKKRAGPLDYVRWPVYGPKHDNQAYADAAEVCAEVFGPERWPIAWGLFAKLVEVAARQASPPQRGWLLGKNGSRISARRLSRLTCFPEDQITQGLAILAHPDIGWIEEREIPAFAESRDARKNVLTEQNRTEQNISDHNRSDQSSRTSATASPPSDEPDSTDGGGDHPFDSTAGSGKPTGKVKPQRIVQILAAKLGWSQKKALAQDPRQAKGDAKCLCIIAEHVTSQRMGPPEEARGLAYDEADRIRAKKLTCPVRSMVCWVKKQLAEHGHEWHDYQE